jgi:hypothetical protein
VKVVVVAAKAGAEIMARTANPRMAEGSADLRTEENFMTITPDTTQVDWIEIATVRQNVEQDQ